MLISSSMGQYTDAINICSRFPEKYHLCFDGANVSATPGTETDIDHLVKTIALFIFSNVKGHTQKKREIFENTRKYLIALNCEYFKVDRAVEPLWALCSIEKAYDDSLRPGVATLEKIKCFLAAAENGIDVNKVDMSNFKLYLAMRDMDPDLLHQVVNNDSLGSVFINNFYELAVLEEVSYIQCLDMSRMHTTLKIFLDSLFEYSFFKKPILVRKIVLPILLTSKETYDNAPKIISEFENLLNSSFKKGDDHYVGTTLIKHLILIRKNTVFYKQEQFQLFYNSYLAIPTDRKKDILLKILMEVPKLSLFQTTETTFFETLKSFSRNELEWLKNLPFNSCTVDLTDACIPYFCCLFRMMGNKLSIKLTSQESFSFLMSIVIEKDAISRLRLLDLSEIELLDNDQLRFIERIIKEESSSLELHLPQKYLYLLDNTVAHLYNRSFTEVKKELTERKSIKRLSLGLSEHELVALFKGGYVTKEITHLDLQACTGLRWSIISPLLSPYKLLVLRLPQNLDVEIGRNLLHGWRNQTVNGQLIDIRREINEQLMSSYQPSAVFTMPLSSTETSPDHPARTQPDERFEDL